jgi:hypothetical protein
MLSVVDIGLALLATPLLDCSLCLIGLCTLVFTKLQSFASHIHEVETPIIHVNE